MNLKTTTTTRKVPKKMLQGMLTPTAFLMALIITVSGTDSLAQTNTRLERGSKLIGEVYNNPDEAKKLTQDLSDIAPDMARFLLEFPYGDIYSRPGLDMKSRQIATIAALTAMGNAAPQLKLHIRAGLNVGLKKVEIVETMMQMCLYAGFPASLNALQSAREVFQEMPAEKFEPKMTKGDQATRLERGSELIAKVYGDPNAAQKMKDGQADIAPDMARFILEFPYGDIYNRPGLDMKSRELATVAALTAMGTATPQLKTHVRASLNVGLTKTEITECIMQMAVYAGFPASLNGLTAAREVYQEKK